MDEISILPADPGQIPGSLLPNEGEGGPVYPGDAGAQTPAAPRPPLRPARPVPVPVPVPIQPLPSPSYVMPNAAVRFVNATHGYPSLRINISGTRVVTLLSPGEASCYSRITPGLRTVSVLGGDGYVYIQQQLSFRAGSAYIVAIANRNGGLALTAAEDVCV